MSFLLRAGAFTHFVELVEHFGADATLLLKSVGLSPAQIQDPDTLVSSSAFVEALQLAAKQTGRPDFGLQLGMRQDIQMLGPVGLLAGQCATAREAIEAISRYINLHNPAASVELQVHGHKALLVYDDIAPGNRRNPQICELALAVGQQILKLFAQPHWKPKAAFFIHKQPRDLAPYKSFFQAPLYFDQEIYALEFERSLLDAKSEQVDEQQKAFFLQYLQQLEKDNAHNIIPMVEQLIRSLLSSGHCNEQRVADIMQITPRTLQRRLKKLDTSFSAQLESIRLQIAQQYLIQSNISLTGIADALGYSELSAFSRFFHRAEGISPSDYRLLHQS